MTSLIYVRKYHDKTHGNCNQGHQSSRCQARTGGGSAFQRSSLSGQSAAVDAAAGGVLQRAMDMGEAEAKLGKVTTMIGSDSVARIVAVGVATQAALQAKRNVRSAPLLDEP